MCDNRPHKVVFRKLFSDYSFLLQLSKPVANTRLISFNSDQLFEPPAAVVVASNENQQVDTLGDEPLAGFLDEATQRK
jgi:hypothetical protein